MSAATANDRPLPMRPSPRDMDAFKPGMAWDLNPYLPWLKRQGERRGVNTLLFVLTAKNCDGCRTFKGQLRKHSAGLESKAMVVIAEVGDLRGACFFAIRMGNYTLRAPGLPTAYVMTFEDNQVQLVASSMGPLDEANHEDVLHRLLLGNSRSCQEAKGAHIAIERNGEPVDEGIEEILIRLILDKSRT